MAITQYEQALRQVRSLSPADQKRLIEELTERLEDTPEQAISILLLQGLGKEIWHDIDVREYVDQERASWNG